MLEMEDELTRCECLHRGARIAGVSTGSAFGTAPLDVGIGWGGIGTTESPLRLLFRIAGERRSEIALAACCLFVAAVSVHDAMLVVLNASVIGEVEQNPVGRWLIELQGGEVWLFVSVKLLTTAVVCAVLVTLYEFRARLALVASGGVAAFQMGLLWYLTFAEC